MCLGVGLCTGAGVTFKRSHHQTKLTLPLAVPQPAGRPWDIFPDPGWNLGYFDLVQSAMAAEG